MNIFLKKPAIYLSQNLVIRIVCGIVLMFLGSQVQIPLDPVPITLQTAIALIIALTYTRAEAIIIYCSYLLLGLIGFPVYSGFLSGINVLIGNSGGYLLGMLCCIYLVTTMRLKFGEKTYMHLLTYSIIGSISVFVFGIPWLAYFIGFEKAFQFGLMPFIIPGILKALFVSATVRLLKQSTWTSSK